MHILTQGTTFVSWLSWIQVFCNIWICVTQSLLPSQSPRQEMFVRLTAHSVGSAALQKKRYSCGFQKHSWRKSDELLCIVQFVFFFFLMSFMVDGYIERCWSAGYLYCVWWLCFRMLTIAPEKMIMYSRDNVMRVTEFVAKARMETTFPVLMSSYM